MELPESKAAARRRDQEDAAARARKRSILVGALGLILLFAAGIGILLSPTNALPLTVAMVLGIFLLLVGFFLIRTPMAGLFRNPRQK